MSAFASHLRQLRKDRGAKKEDIATYLGVTTSYSYLVLKQYSKAD